MKRIFNTAGVGGLLLALGGCNVGSDQNQLPNPTVSTQPALTSAIQPRSLNNAAPSTTANATTAVAASTHTQTYYLVLHGINPVGERIGSAIDFQKSVQDSNNPSVQLIWFEPNRKADGTCLPALGGYDLEYGLQPDRYNTSLRFDLASRDMSCTTVGTTECGDVRECRYNLTL